MNKYQRIDYLAEKIRKNKANLDDYKEYEKLLIENGNYSHNEIMDELLKANIYSYEELIYKRKQVEKDIRRREIIEGIAVVGLVALGLAILFKAFRSK